MRLAVKHNAMANYFINHRPHRIRAFGLHYMEDVVLEFWSNLAVRLANSTFTRVQTQCEQSTLKLLKHWHTSSGSAAKVLLDRGIFHLNVLFYTNH